MIIMIKKRANIPRPSQISGKKTEQNILGLQLDALTGEGLFYSVGLCSVICCHHVYNAAGVVELF